MWTMVQHFLHVLDLIFTMHRIRILMHSRSLLRRSRIDLKNTLTLTVGMRLNRGLPQINTMINPMNLGCHLQNPQNMLIRVDKVRSRYVSSSSEEDQSSATRHRSSKPSGAQPSGAVSDQDQPEHDPDPSYYREVALSDVPSQYAEEVDTFRRILSLPDPRESMPRSSTSVMGLDDEKGCQELRPRGPSSMIPLSSVIKDAFDKFEHDFQAANLPEGKYIKPPPSTAKWYKVGQPCYEEKIQELNTDFAKICITPKPPWAPMGKVPLPILWNTKLGKTSPHSILLLHLLRLLPPAMPLLRSVNMV